MFDKNTNTTEENLMWSKGQSHDVPNWYAWALALQNKKKKKNQEYV